MNISIIGTGNIGGTIAQKLAQAGHRIEVANSKGIDGVRDFASQIGAVASDIDTIGKTADVLILSIPTLAVTQLPKALWERLPAHTVIVDTGNYYPEFRDTPIGEIDNGKVESVWLAEQIGRPVVKAFNMVLAYSLINLGKPKGEPNRLAMWVAGDNLEQKRTVMALVEACGFDALDAGDLANSWQQQPNSAGYCCDYTADELQKVRQNSAQTPQSVAQNRKDYFVKNASLFADPNTTHEHIITASRAMNV